MGVADVNAKLNQLSEQFQQFLKMQGAGSGTVNVVEASGNDYVFASNLNSQVIIDSGATDNMFSSERGLFYTSKDRFYPHVTVANGVTIPTKGTGKASIFQKETDAVIVPDLKTNLLSVSKCANQWNCNIIFTPQKVVFQDRLSRMKIGEGQLVNGLYVVNLNSSALAVTNKVSPQLWHQRLGHPFDHVLSFKFVFRF